MESKQEILSAMQSDLGVLCEPGEWFVITQALINQYVELTGETGWIHTDIERAKASSFGNTIAPGNMGIAILPKLSRAQSPYSRYARKYSLNQGWNRIRFLSPLTTDSRIRSRSRLVQFAEQTDGSIRVEVEFVIEVEHASKPWLSAVKVGRFFY
ncbi:MAG: MaoC/PaaZ C-terminal domain-containing protein [Betaproteobacteria bacterium]|jgi:acyl dehydratase